MTYSAEVLADAPLAYYPLDETSGTTLVDASGNGLNGTYSGGYSLGQAAVASGLGGTSVYFPRTTGVDSVAQVADGTAPEPTTIAVEFWFKPDGTTSIVADLLGRSDLSGTTADSWRVVQIDRTIFARVYVNGSATTAAATTGNVLTAGQAHHIVMRLNGTNLTIEVNGVAAATTARTGTLNPGSAALTIGRTAGTTTNRAKGYLQHVAIYSSLSTTRSAAHYAAGIASGPVTINGGQASETDTARAGAIGVKVTNLETNPSFETGVTGWGAISGSTTPAVSTDHASPGSQSLKTQRGSGTAIQIASHAINGLLTSGAGNYSFALRVWIPASVGTAGNTGIRVGGAGTTNQDFDTDLRDQWVILSGTFAWNGSGNVFMYALDSAIQAGAIIYIDAVTIVAGSTPPVPFDGDTPDTSTTFYDWTSTPHASPSTRVGPPDPVTITGGQASTTSTVFAGVVLVASLLAGGQATEVDEARAGTVDAPAGATTINGGQAAEADTANPGTVGIGKRILGGRALETDTARPGFLGFAATDTANRASGRVRGGYGIASWEPDVAPAPDGLVFGQAQDVASAFSAVTMDGARPVYTTENHTVTRHRDRIVVGGVDVTYFRDIPTPLPAYQLVAPLLYGPATLRLPQIAACFERVGMGELSFLQPGKTVLVQRVDTETGDVVATDYKGIIIAFNADGADLTVEIGGEASGRAALMEKPLPIFRANLDVGFLAYMAITKDLGLPFSPRLGPHTGIKIGRFGGTGELDYISQLCSRSSTRSGAQWSIMPVGGVYKMQRKDLTTVTATAYLDDARTVGNLRRDVAEEPNRIYATTVTPDGQRVRFGVYPGLKQGKAAPYPFNDDRHFSAGTTDADTDTGDGVSLMVARLRVTKYLNADSLLNDYDAEVAAGLRDLQDDAGLPITGNMNPLTWRALFDLDATGYSLRWSHIRPAAQRSYTKPWILSASGAMMRRNPIYNPAKLKIDRSVDMGSGFTRSQAREWSNTEVEESTVDNWVGTVTFHTGALIPGDHSPGDPMPGGVYRARRLQPGMNIRLPNSPGGDIVVHVSGVSVSDDGTVQASVDTRARDSMEVWEVIQRNRESRRDPARQWIRQHRASSEIKDSIDGWDEIGGVLGDKVEIEGGKWTVFPVVAGQEGTVQALEVDTNPNAEYCIAIFGKKVNPKMLQRRVGNPLDITAHISSIEVTDGGSGYTSSPDVVIDGGGGSGAAAHAVVSGGKVVRVNVTSGGNGYTSVPSVSFEGGGTEASGAFATANRSGTGSERWSDPQVAKDLDDRLLLYVAGSAEEPCGYFPRKKQGDHPLTGKWKDAAGFAYYTFAQPVIYVAVYADRDTNIPAGRIMWPQLEAGA